MAITGQAFCFDEAARPYAALGLDAPLLRAIAQAESSLRPDAVQVNGAAGAGRSRSVDIGLMQINSAWLPVLRRHGLTEQHLHDPCTNLKVGAWVLAGNLQRLGNRWEAVGAYNAACTRLDAAQCRHARTRYAWRIHALLHRDRDTHRLSPSIADARSLARPGLASLALQPSAVAGGLAAAAHDQVVR